MDINRSNYNPDGSYSNQPQENATYTAIKCKNIFSKGKFEQELEGRLLIEQDKNQSPTDAGRTISNNPGAANGTRSNNNPETVDSDWVDVNGLQTLSSDVTTDTVSDRENEVPQLLNSSVPTAPTSSGDIIATAGQASPFAGQPIPFAPQKIDKEA
jgi:hypothetical protein